MGPPLLIGAGLGALTSAAMGKSPFTGALLGGATGGMFGGAGGLFGDAAAGAGTGIQLAQPAITEGFGTALAPSVVGGSGAAGITGLGTQSLGGAGITGLGSGTIGAGGAGITGLNTIPLDTSINYGNMSRLAYDTPLSFNEKLSNMGSNLFSYGKENPTSLLNGASTISDMSANADAQSQQRLNNAVATGTQPINKKEFDASSAIAATPSYGLSREEVGKGKVAQIASQAKLNDETERKIRQFYNSYIG